MKRTGIFPPQFRDVDPQPSVCRTCGVSLDSATGLTDADAPKAGSVSICAYCGEVAIYEDDRLLREPTEAELATLQASKDWPMIEEIRTMLLPRREGRGS